MSLSSPSSSSSSPSTTASTTPERSNSQKQRVVLGVSGGVDSSAAAVELQRRGYDVVALFMHNWDELDETGHCSGENELKDARRVCEALGIEMHEVNFVKEYWELVFQRMLAMYEAGTTPNPDVWCNREIKFKLFLEHALEQLGGDYVATGHYARLQRADGDGRVALLAGTDTERDQTYFLCSVQRDAFRRVLFPIGDMTKEQVREIARDAGLHHVADKKTSVGLCFVGKRDFPTFLKQYQEPAPGWFVDGETGKRLQEHSGFSLFTVGQSSRISGQPDKMYVAYKDRASKDIVVVRGSHHPGLYSSALDATEFNWLVHPGELRFPMRCLVRTMYRQELRPCTVKALKTDNTSSSSSSSSASSLLSMVEEQTEEAQTDVTQHADLRVDFEQPQRAVAPGQYVVLYDMDGQRCLGGGMIKSHELADENMLGQFQRALELSRRPPVDEKKVRLARKLEKRRLQRLRREEQRRNREEQHHRSGYYR